MSGIEQRIEELHDHQRKVVEHLESEITAKINAAVDLLAMCPSGLGFSQNLGRSLARLIKACEEAGVMHLEDAEEGQRQRVSGDTKKEFLKNWISQQSEPFTHRKMCQAFAELNCGNAVQRSYYLEQLKELKDEGVVKEETIGEGERPRIIFRRAKAP